MALSALAITSPKNPFTIHEPLLPSRRFSHLSPFSCFSCLSNNKESNFSSNSVSTRKKCIFDMGIGLLAASILAFTPMDANATRIEYYATVGDPLCDFNFVRSGLGYCDISVGSGQEAPYGQLVNVHYTARFADGIVFDSSYKRGRPLTMRIGVGKVIKGLDQGILGGEGVPPMQIGMVLKTTDEFQVFPVFCEWSPIQYFPGGKRKLQIPPHLAYGPEPAGCFSGDCNIPGNATLVYDINLLGIYSGNRK